MDSRAWITSFWFVERARWSWLALWAALLALLKQRFSPAVWHVILDGPSRQRRRRYTVVAFGEPALIGCLPRPGPWRRPGELTAGIIRTGLDGMLRQVGVAGLVTPKSPEIDAANLPAGPRPPPRRSLRQESWKNLPPSPVHARRYATAVIRLGYKLQSYLL